MCASHFEHPKGLADKIVVVANMWLYAPGTPGCPACCNHHEVAPMGHWNKTCVLERHLVFVIICICANAKVASTPRHTTASNNFFSRNTIEDVFVQEYVFFFCNLFHATCNRRILGNKFRRKYLCFGQKCPQTKRCENRSFNCNTTTEDIDHLCWFGYYPVRPVQHARIGLYEA